MSTDNYADSCASAAYWGRLATSWIASALRPKNDEGCVEAARKYAVYAGTCARIALDAPDAPQPAVIEPCDVCDRCGAVSAQYTGWARCTSCRGRTCPECAVRGSWESGDGETNDLVLCLDCQTCAHCDTQPATHFLEASATEDLCCDVCYAEFWTTCEHCGAETMKANLETICSARQTWSSPAEYETRCEQCLPRDRRDDEDARADRAYDDENER